MPGQWSFPLDLPARLLGIDTAGTGGGELVDTSPASNPPPAGAARAAWCAADPRAACATTAAYARAADFTDEFEVKLLRPERRLGLGYAANEAALLHKDTKVAARARSLVLARARSRSLALARARSRSLALGALGDEQQ